MRRLEPLMVSVSVEIVDCPTCGKPARRVTPYLESLGDVVGHGLTRWLVHVDQDDEGRHE